MPTSTSASSMFSPKASFAAARTETAAATISGPMSSPGITAIFMVASVSRERGIAPRSRAYLRTGLESDLVGDLHPTVVILADALTELLRRAATGYHSVALEVPLDDGVLQRLVDAGIQPVDDGLRRAARRHCPEPEHDVVTRQRLGDGGNVGQGMPALGRRHG